MVTDSQVRRLRELTGRQRTMAVAAAKAGMDEKTARKYRRLGRLPSEMRVEHTWRTRLDPLAGVWEELRGFLRTNPGLEAKTLFGYLQRREPGRFADGQLRTLQRRVKVWRATEGPGREVMFPQVYQPGKLGESDFTHMGGLGVSIGGQPFDHLIYHFVLPYSNWETGTVCFSESFESLSEGLQNALWELGGVPEEHRTDRLSSAVHRMDHPEEFTRRYQALLDHYGLRGRRIQGGEAHENGDVEQCHYRFKDAMDQALMLRGDRDFEDREGYGVFLRELLLQLNAGRRGRLAEELRVLRRLPVRRLDTAKRVRVRVGPSSTLRVNHNVYSVHSRLIGEEVEVRLYAEHLEVWYAQRRLDTVPRLRGEGKHHIQYRHIIEWLVRKPGAFANYRYREALFPTSRFRLAYDVLCERGASRASREYLGILQLAAQEGETGVDEVLAAVLGREEMFDAEAIRRLVLSAREPAGRVAVRVDPVDLEVYDGLLGVKEMGPWSAPSLCHSV